MINLRTPAWLLVGLSLVVFAIAGFVLAMLKPELPVRVRSSAIGAVHGWQRAVAEQDASREGVGIEAYLHARVATLEAENQVVLRELANALELIDALAQQLVDTEQKTQLLEMLAADLVQQVAAEPYVVPAEAPEPRPETTTE